MADIVVGSADFDVWENSLLTGPVWTGPLTAYWFGIEANDIGYRKTIDGGDTWSAKTQIYNTFEPAMISIWYDRWTPDDTGTVIHIALWEGNTDDVHYYTLDTATDTLSGTTSGGTIVFAGASFALHGEFSSEAVFISKSRGGRLFIGFDGDNYPEVGFYSSDDGSTWSSRTVPFEGAGSTGTEDTYLLLPGNGADPNDMWLLYWDTDTSELSLKTFDDSANSWSEQLIAGSMAYDAGAIQIMQMSASVRHSDGHMIVAAFSQYNNAAADLRVWDINGAGSITELTAVLSNTTGAAWPDVFIDQNTDAIYVAYLRGTLWTSTLPYYKVSTDGGTTWGVETVLSDDAAGANRAVWAGVSVGGDLGRYRPVFVRLPSFRVFGFVELEEPTPTECTVTVSSPAHLQVVSALPAIAWTLENGPQTSYHVKIYSDSARTVLVYDSGLVISATGSHTVSEALDFETTYYLTVTVTTAASECEAEVTFLTTQEDEDAEEIECTIAGLRGPVWIKPRYTIRDVNWVEFEDITKAVASARINFDAKREITREANFTFTVALLPERFHGPRINVNLPGTWIGIEMLLTVNGEERAFPMGLYRLTNVRPELEENEQSKVTAKGLDPAVLLTSSSPFAYWVPAGTSYTDAVATLLANVGITRNEIVPSVKTTPNDMSWQPNVPYIRIANDLLEGGLNYWPLWFDGEAYARSRYRGNPEQDTFAIDVRYTDSEPVMVIPPFVPVRDIDKPANQVASVIMDPTREPLASIARNEHHAPNGINILGRTINKQVTNDWAYDQETLNSHAEWELVEEKSQCVQAELYTFPDPRRNPRNRLREIYYVEVDNWLDAVDNEPARKYWMCVGWSLDLTHAGARMQHSLQSLLPGEDVIIDDDPEPPPPPPPDDDDDPTPPPPPPPPATLITITTRPGAATADASWRIGIVWTSALVGYLFNWETSGPQGPGGAIDLVWRKTVNGGTSWGGRRVIASDPNRFSNHLSIWYDQWTPGLAGGVIHVIYSHLAFGNVYYRQLNTTTDSVTSEQLIYDNNGMMSFGSNRSAMWDILRSASGHVYALWDGAPSPRGFYRSGAPYTIWTALADPLEEVGDELFLMPANEGTAEDVYVIYWDKSAEEVSLKLYDAGLDSFSETSIGTGIQPSFRPSKQWDAALRADGHVFLAVWDNDDELKVWEIADSTSITQRTSVKTNMRALNPFGATIDEVSGTVAVFVNDATQAVYVAYQYAHEVGAGNPPHVYYRRSDDGGVTWGDETAVLPDSVDLDVSAGVFTGVRAAAGRYMPVVFDHYVTDSTLALLIDTSTAEDL